MVLTAVSLGKVGAISKGNTFGSIEYFGLRKINTLLICT